MGVYDGASALAQRLIAAKGKRVTFARRGVQTDPLSPALSSGETFDAYVVAIALEATKARYLFGEAADITKPRLSLYVSLKDTIDQPAKGDTFTWGGRKYAVLAMTPLDPNDGGAIYASGYAEAA